MNYASQPVTNLRKISDKGTLNSTLINKRQNDN